MKRAAGTQHVTDKDLLLHHAGELPAGALPHLQHCSRCRARQQQLVTMEREACAAAAAFQLPTDFAARTRLQTGLAAAHAPRGPKAGASLLAWLRQTRRPAFPLRAAVVLALLVAAVLSRQLSPLLQNGMGAYEETGPEPDHLLTPGSAVQLTVAEVCRRTDDDLDPPVTAEMQRAVFHAYRMDGRKARAYQVDYLINPQLGGDNSLQNLWPEPYHATVWNATAKDALETRLHAMVCNGQLDLPTAQRELASDWIGAYKKYFHADRPVQTVAALSTAK